MVCIHCSYYEVSDESVNNSSFAKMGNPHWKPNLKSSSSRMPSTKLIQIYLCPQCGKTFEKPVNQK